MHTSMEWLIAWAYNAYYTLISNDMNACIWVWNGLLHEYIMPFKVISYYVIVKYEPLWWEKDNEGHELLVSCVCALKEWRIRLV